MAHESEEYISVSRIYILFFISDNVEPKTTEIILTYSLPVYIDKNPELLYQLIVRGKYAQVVAKIMR